VWNNIVGVLLGQRFSVDVIDDGFCGAQPDRPGDANSAI
jgi:hypothetical protein